MCAPLAGVSRHKGKRPRQKRVWEKNVRPGRTDAVCCVDLRAWPTNSAHDVLVPMGEGDLDEAVKGIQELCDACLDTELNTRHVSLSILREEARRCSDHAMFIPKKAVFVRSEERLAIVPCQSALSRMCWLAPPKCKKMARLLILMMKATQPTSNSLPRTSSVLDWVHLHLL